MTKVSKVLLGVTLLLAVCGKATMYAISLTHGNRETFIERCVPKTVASGADIESAKLKCSKSADTFSL